MSDLFNFEGVDFWIYQILLVDMAVAVVMLAGLRYVTGLIANVSSREELASRDNYAFGVAMAGGTLGLAIMMTGAFSGEPGISLVRELISVLSYGVLGLVLIKAGRYVQDKVVLRGIAIQAEIKAGNLAAALLDVANTVSIGVVLRAVMLWVESDTWHGLLMVLAAFIITQCLIALVTAYRLFVYSRRHEGNSLQAALHSGNVALAIRFLGHILGVSLALTAASGVVTYNAENLLAGLLGWALVTGVFSIMVSILSVMARNVILHGVNVIEEVDQQQNIGVAAIEASVYISIGLFFLGLFA